MAREMLPGKRRLLIRRKGYRVRPTKYYRKGKLIKRKGYFVKPTVYYKEDIGAPGRGPKVIKIRRVGAVNRIAREMGYERFTDIPMRRIKTFAEKLVAAYGALTAFKMMHAQVIFRKRTKFAGYRKFVKARDYIGDKYGVRLTPYAAIRAWKRMPPRERARRMPGGKI